MSRLHLVASLSNILPRHSWLLGLELFANSYDKDADNTPTMDPTHSAVAQLAEDARSESMGSQNSQTAKEYDALPQYSPPH